MFVTCIFSTTYEVRITTHKYFPVAFEKGSLVALVAFLSFDWVNTVELYIIMTEYLNVGAIVPKQSVFSISSFIEYSWFVIFRTNLF